MASTINAISTGAGGLISTGDASGQLQLQTTGTTAVTIDTSQNVGIGTTSPGYKLQVYGASNPEMRLGDAVVTYQLYTEGATAAVMGTVGSHALVYRTNATERMRIDSSGGVSIGATATYLGTEKFSITATAAGWPMSLYASGSAANGMYIKYSTTPNNTGSEFFYFTDATAQRASMRSNGGLANYSANNVNLSDERLKTDILPATTYLDKICSIPVVTFKYKDQTDNELNLGVIAQEVDKVAPELVDHSGFGETPEGESPYLAIYQTDLQYALMKCIQEQQTIINDLKARIEKLEAK